jgi:hypothetical protein
MSFSSSRGSTPSSSPISIASRSSSFSFASLGPNYNSTPTACQPFSSSLMRRPSNERPSAYVSDDDLLGADDAPYMRHAPSPPRPAEMWLARPLLPPVNNTKSSRTNSSLSRQVKP